MNELDKLRTMLADAGIPFISYSKERIKTPYDLDIYGDAGRFERNQIIYGGEKYGIRYGHYLFDGICQYGSYGASEGMIETYGTLGWDKRHEPRVLNAEQAFAIISEHWNRRADNG